MTFFILVSILNNLLMEKKIMNNKKILLSFLLVVLIAISVGSVSAEDAADAVDVVAVDDSADVIAADIIQPANNTVSDVQTAVDAAKEGDTVDLSKFTEYDFTNQTVTIKTNGIIIDGKGTTTIKGYGDGNGILAINKAQNVVIQGIKFIDTNPKNDFRYNGTTAGWGISASAAAGGLIKDCEFTDFNSGIVVMQTTGFTIENNKFNGGYTTQLFNDPTVNKEQGSKSLNIYRQSSGVIVKNNTFEGPILDGVSIAQGSGANYVLENTFIGNCYSIYFGGASTANSLIANNTFTNCGFFKEGNISWDGLPVISIQKASDNIAIKDNLFEAIDNNILVAAEKGNEAHGSPTTIENINITGNTVVPCATNVDMATVTLFHVLVRDGSSLEIPAPLNITNNKFTGAVKGISIWFDDNEIYSADEGVLTETLYPNYLYGTTVEASDVTVLAGDMGYIKLILKDSKNNTLRDKAVVVTLADNVITAYTNENGEASIPFIEESATTKYVTAIYLGEGSIYKPSFDTAKITVNKKATALTAAKATLKVKKAKKVTVTLKDSKGKAVAGKKITITVNKKTFTAKTNKNGKATISVKVTKKGKFTATVKFAGDGAYKAVTKKVKYTVK